VRQPLQELLVLHLLRRPLRGLLRELLVLVLLLLQLLLLLLLRLLLPLLLLRELLQHAHPGLRILRELGNGLADGLQGNGVHDHWS
jgi:hypothetical protein